MAYEFYCTIEGTKQGAFKGESMRDAHKDKIACISMDHEVISPRDISSGQAAGKRQHRPIVITKEWGAASPQLFQALCTNEVLKSVLFEFYKTDANGTEVLYHQIKLINATVSRIKKSTGAGFDSAGSSKQTGSWDTHELEHVAFTYQRLEMDDKLA